MEVFIIRKTSRFVIAEVADGGYFFTKAPIAMLLNGKALNVENKTINCIFGLKPDTDYTLEVIQNTEKAVVLFHTEKELFTLNVKDFGAAGDGIADDTTKIQAALNCCPEQSRVLIPKGVYRITSLFLKSDITVELEREAVLLAEKDRNKYPVLPGLIESWDEKSEYNLGSWEGNPLKMFSGIITGIGVSNVTICGEGEICGNAVNSDWWVNEKVMRGAFRPRLMFFNRCSDIKVIGLRFSQSPSWTIHPYFSENIEFIGLDIENCMNSPNTDGINPESCKNVVIAGVKFSLGDDCIAVKSGKIYMGLKYKAASENINVRQCLMENGHGAVTVGSEMAAGVKKLTVRECVFRNTDRGIRIKTRRGRGNSAILDNIVFEKLTMDGVKIPFAINSFYFCDPDGKSDYVQNRNKLPADERTPSIKSLVFTDISAVNCHAQAAFFIGLPEKKIEQITMRNVHISFAEKPVPFVPEMLCGVSEARAAGVYACNIKHLILEGLVIEGQVGEPVILENVDEAEGIG